MSSPKVQGILLTFYVLFICWVPIFGSDSETANVNDKLLATMQKYMRTTAHPCYDLYHYSCGYWKRQNSDNWYDIILEYDEQLKDLITKRLESRKQKWNEYWNSKADDNDDEDDDGDTFVGEPNEVYAKILDFFDSYRGWYGRDFLNELVPMENETWPYWTDSWSPKEKLNIWWTFGQMAAAGLQNFPFQAEVLYRNSTHHYLLLDKYQGQYKDYEKFYVRDMKKYGKEHGQQNADSITEFMNQLELLAERHHDDVAVQMTLSALKQQVAGIDFLSYFSAMFNDTNVGHLLVTVRNLQYFQDLAKLIASTSDEALLRTIAAIYGEIFDNRHDTADGSYKSYIEQMRDILPLALEYIYDREIYAHEKQSLNSQIEKVFKALQQKFVEVLEANSNNFTPKEVGMLKEKILNMKLNIGNLFRDADDQFYAEYFRSWNVSHHSFYLNVVNAQRHKTAVKYRLLKRNGLSSINTAVDSPIVTPTYIIESNTLIIPHAYLRFPRVHPELNELFMFAELGSSMAQEIMRGFVMDGLNFTATGNPSHLDFSGNTKFQSSLACFVKRNLAGHLIETISIYSGLRLAYDAYFKQAEEAAFNSTKSLSNKQLFFIKFAQFFCTRNDEPVTYGFHKDLPFEEIPNLALNHPEFDEVFVCPKRSRQHLLEKCNLW